MRFFKRPMSDMNRFIQALLRVSGIEVLNKALGPAAALRFLTLLHHEPTDYVEVSRRLYEGQTIEEIFERAKQHWEG